MRAHLEGVDKFVPAGQSIIIEPGLYHTFHNNSDTEPLVTLTGLDPSEREGRGVFFEICIRILTTVGRWLESRTWRSSCCFCGSRAGELVGLLRCISSTKFAYKM